MPGSNACPPAALSLAQADTRPRILESDSEEELDLVPARPDTVVILILVLRAAPAGETQFRREVEDGVNIESGAQNKAFADARAGACGQRDVAE